MKIVFLDSATLGRDVSLEPIAALGELVCYDSTPTEKVFERISDCDVLIINKVKVGKPPESTTSMWIMPHPKASRCTMLLPILQNVSSRLPSCIS